MALEQAKETENKQYADMKLRIKYMYEQGNTSYIDMLFQSEDMVQLMNRAEYINKISDYDRKKMDEYEATRQTIADEEQKLKDDREALLDMQEKTKAKQESVKTLRAQKNKEMQSYAGQIDTAQSQVDQYNADLAAQENKIKQIEAEIRRKEEEERKKAEAARKAEEEARKKAEAAGIPVIFFNRAIEDDKTEGDVLGSYDKCAFVGTDAPEAGHMQGEMIGNYVVEHFDEMDLNGDGKISYAMFMGQLGNAEAIYRTQFAVEDADKIITDAGKPALEYFDASNSDKYQVDQDGNWSATAANNYMTTNLSQYNEGSNNMIELVICNNDGMAEGAVSALNDKGYNLGTGKDCKMIPVFGVDATDAAKQLIADGKMTATVKQDADGMAACIADLAKNAAGGKDLMDGTDSYNISEKVSNKIFIPYQEYSGK